MATVCKLIREFHSGTVKTVLRADKFLEELYDELKFSRPVNETC